MLTAIVVELFEYTVDNIEKVNILVGIQLDLSKAFDCLSHDMILSKLLSPRIRNTTLAWFAAYLEGRQQVVEVAQTTKGVSITTITKKI